MFSVVMCVWECIGLVVCDLAHLDFICYLKFIHLQMKLSFLLNVCHYLVGEKCLQEFIRGCCIVC